METLISSSQVKETEGRGKMSESTIPHITPEKEEELAKRWKVLCKGYRMAASGHQHPIEGGFWE